MQLGKIEQVATLPLLFAKPANLFVASFIDTPQMNLLEAILIGTSPLADGSISGRFRLVGEEITAVVNANVATLKSDSKVTLGIRPRSFEFVAPNSADALHPIVDLLKDTPVNSAIFGWVLPSSRSNTICIRWRTVGFFLALQHFLQAFYLIVVALDHPTPLRIRWT